MYYQAEKTVDDLKKASVDIANQLDHDCEILYHRLRRIGPLSADTGPLR